MYSREQRRKAIETFIRFEHSVADTIAELGYPNRHTLYNWWKEYQLSGEEFLERKRRKPKYPDEKKRAAVDYYLEHGKSLTKTIRAMGYPSREMLGNWVDVLAPGQRKYRGPNPRKSAVPIELKVQAVAELESRTGSAADVGVTSAAYWFLGFSALTEVYGFQHLSGITDATQMFSSCGQLRSIFATGFDYSAIKKYSGMFYGNTRLVGGTDGFVPTTTSGASVCKVGTGGVLTDPSADKRTWFTGTLFGDGELVISASVADAGGREVLATGLVCANAKYNAIQCNPWADFGKQVARVTVTADMAALAAVNMNYWFYGCTALTSVSGMGNLRGVSQMRFTFNSCSALAELDMRGFDPGSLTNVDYLFGSCSALKTVLVDAGWTLPKSGLSGMSTFYNCKAIVGGNGTTFNSSKTGYAMMRVDTAAVTGYLTAG